nr:MAG TPA: hypothetical protein [Caudoviricetes sp.]DAT69745.1 MAG TPA: hypothetical protein [Caudoviricetes sp.]
MKISNIQKELNCRVSCLKDISSEIEKENIDDTLGIKSLFLLGKISAFMFTSQKRSSLLKKWIDNDLGLSSLPPSSNAGNSYNPQTNQNIRVVISFKDRNRQVKFRQIRPWQNIHKYIVVYIDPDNKENCRVFDIPSEVINVAAIECGTYCHGTTEDNLRNERIERSLNYSYRSPVLDKYRKHNLEVRWFK